MSQYSFNNEDYNEIFSLLSFFPLKFWFISGREGCKSREWIQRDGKMNGTEMRDEKGTKNKKFKRK